MTDEIEEQFKRDIARFPGGGAQPSFPSTEAPGSPSRADIERLADEAGGNVMRRRIERQNSGGGQGNTPSGS